MPGLSFTCNRISVRRSGGSQTVDSSHDDPLAINQVSITVQPGEQIAVIGPSGAGKTTLLSMLAAALEPTDGSVDIDGMNPWRLGSRSLRRLRRQLFLAPQVPPLPPRQRVATAVLAGRLPVWSLVKSIASLLRTSDAELAYEALNAFSIGDKLWHRVDRLSGGERQRVSLARGLVSEARAMLIDEPLSALDPALSGQTLHTLINHCTEQNKTLICSLHQVELALENFPRVIGLRRGELLFDLASDQVKKDTIRELYFGYEDQTSVTPLITEDANPVSAPSPPTRCA